MIMLKPISYYIIDFTHYLDSYHPFSHVTSPEGLKMFLSSSILNNAVEDGYTIVIKPFFE